MKYHSKLLSMIKWFRKLKMKSRDHVNDKKSAGFRNCFTYPYMYGSVEKYFFFENIYPWNPVYQTYIDWFLSPMK